MPGCPRSPNVRKHSALSDHSATAPEPAGDFLNREASVPKNGTRNEPILATEFMREYPWIGRRFTNTYYVPTDASIRLSLQGRRLTATWVENVAVRCARAYK
jgi:hypothetical protein